MAATERPEQALVVRLRSFAVKLSWRRPIVSISASCPREHPRTAHGIHAANVGLCESPIQKVAWAMSGARSQAVWVAAAAAGLEVVRGAGLVVAPSFWQLGGFAADPQSFEVRGPYRRPALVPAGQAIKNAPASRWQCFRGGNHGQAFEKAH
jgi:hypothetical protein